MAKRRTSSSRRLSDELLQHKAEADKETLADSSTRRVFRKSIGEWQPIAAGRSSFTGVDEDSTLPIVVPLDWKKFHSQNILNRFAKDPKEVISSSLSLSLRFSFTFFLLFLL